MSNEPLPLPAISELLGALEPSDIAAFVESLDQDELLATLSDWSLWSLPYQQLPPGAWRRWVMRCGRGTGKTYTGSRTTNEVARDRAKIKNGEIGLIARTWSDARFTMVEGPSGILATAPPDFRPEWQPGLGLLTWPNGVRGRIYAAESPGSIRGPNLSWVWGDEVEHWARNERVWYESIEFALRIGWARAILTSTPIKGSRLLRKLEAKDDTVVTRAATRDNPYLTREVRDTFYEHFDGTRIGRQELLGDIIDEIMGALWDLGMIDPFRVEVVPDMQRIVIAVDPAVSNTERSAEHGLVACGLGVDDHGYCLEDRSRKGSPEAWASVAVAMYRRFEADCIVAEVNNGGDLVESVIRAIDPTVNVKQVRATRGKMIRAEPVSALAERKKLHHVGSFPQLEEQLCTREPGDTEGFDRFDAYVWGFTELMLKPAIGPLSAYL